MSKQYDYSTALKMIQMKSDVLESASLGIEEDWFWTAETVYEGGKFSVDLTTEPAVAGIKGSRWATPSISLVYKDGREELIACYTGDSSSEKPEWFELGVLSGPAQEQIEQVKRPKLN